MNLDRLYQDRFESKDILRKERIWRVLYKDFFARHVDESGAVLDIAAGYCEWINQVPVRGSAKRIACDLNPDTKLYAAKNVDVHITSAENLSFLEDGSVRTVFISNFFEHLRDKDSILRILNEASRVLEVGGSILILQPNIRFAYKEYWDFADHYTPLSDRSLIELIHNTGSLRVKTCYPRFLPYTTKSRLPQAPILVQLYLHIRPAWLLFGKQCFVVANKY